MKKQGSGPSGYYFPDDCWELVFHKLRQDDKRDLDSISLVSKRFLSLSNRVKLSLNVNDGTLPPLPNYSSEILQMTHTGGQEMDLSFPEHKNYRLRHLDISENIWVNDTTLESFGQVCPNLQILDVSCTCLTNSGIGEVLRRCPAITQLNICGLNILDVFGSYSDHSVLNLKTLEAQDTQIDDEGMAMIENRCRNLQYLDIGSCKKVTDKGVMEVVRNCERLRDILMGGCEKVSASIVLQMVSSRPSLRNIEPPCFDDLSEQMINKVLSFGCRLNAIRLWLSS
ncbi:hypothetical protein RHSIM_Rhsim01G0030600 [Rhododendron simsii]|uniref:F-box/LRR-repeat protein 15-like leucin rich repeat domain-containing protein n=1 Tax=Rhododendron simsii TaxID=118357 RepID=A0A834HFK3_RHOSS|nr:hypothetical protein RHSIM_Rhsim01G0030600 [Rhododendron simsii]